jgi:endonuclease/exonuclease/phosphatase family metal-dependent hydrolase
VSGRPEGHLRLLSWNIAAGRVPLPGPNLERIAEVLAAADADLVALQEVDRGQERSGRVDQAARLADALGMRAWFTPAIVYDTPAGTGGRGLAQAAPDPGGAAYGIALLSRVELSVPERLVLPQAGLRPASRRRLEPRVAMVTTVAAGERLARPLTLAVAHLANAFPWSLVQLRHLQARLTGPGRDGPLVLAGDLNLRPLLVRALARRGWRGVLHGLTFPGEAPTRQLDHVLLTGAGSPRVAGICIPDAPVSDHRPVQVDLDLSPASS